MKLAIAELLEAKGIDYKLYDLDDVAISVDDVLRLSRGLLKSDEVCKTIIIRGRKTNTLRGILLKGEDKLDFKKLKKVYGEDVAIATHEEVLRVSGVDPGAVCPFLLMCPLFVEQRVLELSKMNCGSGSHLHGLECAIKDIGKVIDYTPISVRKEDLQAL